MIKGPSAEKGGTQGKDDLGQSKDDLGESRTARMESMDSTTLLNIEDSCHPRVIELRNGSSTRDGDQVPDQGQEEELMDPLVPHRPTDLGTTTTGQSSMDATNQFIGDGPFVGRRELRLNDDEYEYRDVQESGDDAQQGGMQGQYAIRTDRGEDDEE